VQFEAFGGLVPTDGLAVSNVRVVGNREVTLPHQVNLQPLIEGSVQAAQSKSLILEEVLESELILASNWVTSV
jgi:hypothetical protein